MTFAKIEHRLPSLSERQNNPPPPIIEGTVFGGENTLAFNLTSEWDRAKELGDGYRKTFLDNAHFYAGETYLKGRSAIFEYKVSDEGKLYYPNSNIGAVASFQKPMSDTSRPAWLRKRDASDLSVVVQIESSIKSADIGDTWVAASPAISDKDVPQDTKKEWGYGRHSFLFLHQLQTDPATGQRKLVCRALRHYLSEDVQKQLISELGGRQIPDEAELHGYVAKLAKTMTPRNFKVQDSMHIANIHSLGSEVGKKHGQTYWGQESEGASDIEKLDNERMAQIAKLDWWLEDVYQDILDLGESPKLSRLKAIESKFRGWENAVKTISDGKTIDAKLFVSHLQNGRKGGLWKESVDNFDPRVAYIQAAITMQSGLGTCGVGSGFGVQMPGTLSAGEVSMFGIHPVMSVWSGVAIDIRGGQYVGETSTHYESYQCPGCKNWLSGEKKDDKNSWRTKCDHCGNKLNC